MQITVFWPFFLVQVSFALARHLAKISPAPEKNGIQLQSSTDRHVERQIDRHRKTDRQTQNERQKNRQTDKQTDKQTDRQTDKQTNI